MFTDDGSRMRWALPNTSNNNGAEGFLLVILGVADPEGLSCGTIICHGGGEFEGCFEQLVTGLGIKTTRNAQYNPQGNEIAEGEFGLIIAIAQSFMHSAPLFLLGFGLIRL